MKFRFQIGAHTRRFGAMALLGVASVLSGTAQTGASPSAEEQETERPRPGVLVFVEGGPEERTIWRGWPVLIHAVALGKEPVGELQVRGPSSVTPQKQGAVWLIPAAASAQLSPGPYVFAIGSATMEVTVADPPAQLSPETLAIRRRISVRGDIASGNAAAAVQTAREVVGADPKSSDAHALLGDALLAAGDRAGAAAAYDEAIRRVPRGVKPPASLYAKAAALLREDFAVPAADPSTPATAR